MHRIAQELDQALGQMDAQRASQLEQLIRDALVMVRANGTTPGREREVDALGWPVGHLEKYLGCLAGDDWEPPADPPPESSQVW